MSWAMKIGVNATTRSSVSASRLLSSLNISMPFIVVDERAMHPGGSDTIGL